MAAHMAAHMAAPDWRAQAPGILTRAAGAGILTTLFSPRRHPRIARATGLVTALVAGGTVAHAMRRALPDDRGRATPVALGVGAALAGLLGVAAEGGLRLQSAGEEWLAGRTRHHRVVVALLGGLVALVAEVLDARFDSPDDSPDDSPGRALDAAASGPSTP